MDNNLYVVFDSAPFTNGDLHLGHARTYVLGDVDARFHRLIGRNVIYTTNFDVFGLPTTREARRRGCPEQAVMEASRSSMLEDMHSLGLSYDWNRIRSTNDPDYVRGTQRLFQALLADGLASKKEVPAWWCTSCDTSVSEIQIQEGACDRCGDRVENRTLFQWVVRISDMHEVLYEGIDHLTGWSERGRNLLKAFMGRQSDDSFRLGDWDVSRQVNWGTPIPIVHCNHCGIVGIPDDELPWFPPEGNAACPVCGEVAEPERDRLDCFFDDAWFFVSWSGRDPFEQEWGRVGTNATSVRKSMPATIFNSGYDTWVYLHLYRFIGRFMWQKGLLTGPEPFQRYLGHDVIVRAGEKMSKSRGNAISVRSVLRTHHPDELRFSLIAASAPDKPIHWVDERLSLGRAAIRRIMAMIEEVEISMKSSGRLEAMTSRRSGLVLPERELNRARGFYQDYRPHAAAQELMLLVDRLRKQLRKGLIEPDRARTWGRAILTALSPIIPFTSEEGLDRLSGDHNDRVWPATPIRSGKPTGRVPE